MLESVWEQDRIRLYQEWKAHPDWSNMKLAQTLGRSLSWVKKWLKRVRDIDNPRLQHFQSASRAPKTRPKTLARTVWDAILDYRDHLGEQYGRVVGPKTILYHLHQDKILKASGAFIPKAVSTIWKVLRQAGRIRQTVLEPHPVERPEPLEHWEMDFGQLSDKIEFMSVVDRGTSILVNTQSRDHYTAETALLAVAELFVRNGLPKCLRFDNDPRFVGSSLTDGYPSPLLRFLWVLGVEPDRVPPGKPYLKPFVERSIRVIKYEFLWLKRPSTSEKAAELLEQFRHFYNHQRAHQGSACNNQPPYVAFPSLPTLPHLPETVDPDRWLKHYHRRVFRRKVGQNGSIQVGNHTYYIDYKLAGETVGVYLDAELRVFRILHEGKVIQQPEIQGLVGHELPFQAFLERMLEEARTTTRE
jgi:transposase InsO family protein